jgi:hypothetical protein
VLLEIPVHDHQEAVRLPLLSRSLRHRRTVAYLGSRPPHPPIYSHPYVLSIILHDCAPITQSPEVFQRNRREKLVNGENSVARGFLMLRFINIGRMPDERLRFFSLQIYFSFIITLSALLYAHLSLNHRTAASIFD